MFDDPTSELIRSAPELSGLDPNSLPKALTKAYAEIISVRLRLRKMAEGTSNAADLLENLRPELQRLRRIAFTQEAMASVNPDGPKRRGAAFLAATAHYVTLQAQRLVSPANQSDVGLLTVGGVAQEVSATLLFLAAGASPDAAEMSREIHIPNGLMQVERRLLQDIKRLATGELDALLADSTIPETISPDGELTMAEVGASALYLMLQRCVQSIAAEVLGRPGHPPSLPELERVEALCTQPAVQFLNRLGNSSFPGPRHLASLLKAVGSELPGGSLARLPPPPGVGASLWTSGLALIAKTRPYLWENHRDAVARGYLTPGVSAAISFPTGAGKSTLSELNRTYAGSLQLAQ
ncbi:hypothetical protein [Sphaerotilus microaerophilus]|uniref:Uncharacterized protein n=1 Tax=Sphaerotilus microaerophilus TaxID=2914710 RepID=A0ABN6PI83_9BURK|nr:hypothetical protein [Sphaerotilus sp. FB-5]BDI04739.1 hypothetical protein CATMQ487_17090 [Sphaerotilus sp. FB-5]